MTWAQNQRGDGAEMQRKQQHPTTSRPADPRAHTRPAPPTPRHSVRPSTHQPLDPAPSTHLVQICLHQLKHDIDVFEVAGGGGQHDVLDFHNVRVAQQAQQLDLSQDARRVCGAV